MPDLRGHGNSSAEGPFGLEEWGGDCLSVLDDFDIASVHLVGGSLGGPLAVYLAALRPDRVVSITSIGGALHIEGDNPESVLAVLREKGVQGMFREVLPKISVAPGTDEETLERILALTNPNDAETVAAIWGATIAADAHEAARSVRCPALVINGEYDATCTPEQGEAMAKALGTKMTVMEGVGHLPMFEAPVELARLISDHLERAEA
jgi:pimeloyl-ACP methyl ester carboxylesterase